MRAMVKHSWFFTTIQLVRSGLDSMIYGETSEANFNEVGRRAAQMLGTLINSDVATANTVHIIPSIGMEAVCVKEDEGELKNFAIGKLCSSSSSTQDSSEFLRTFIKTAINSSQAVPRCRTFAESHSAPGWQNNIRLHLRREAIQQARVAPGFPTQAQANSKVFKMYPQW